MEFTVRNKDDFIRITFCEMSTRCVDMTIFLTKTGSPDISASFFILGGELTQFLFALRGARSAVECSLENSKSLDEVTVTIYTSEGANIAIVYTYGISDVLIQVEHEAQSFQFSLTTFDVNALLPILEYLTRG